MAYKLTEYTSQRKVNFPTFLKERRKAKKLGLVKVAYLLDRNEEYVMRCEREEPMRIPSYRMRMMFSIIYGYDFQKAEAKYIDPKHKPAINRGSAYALYGHELYPIEPKWQEKADAALKAIGDRRDELMYKELVTLMHERLENYEKGIPRKPKSMSMNTRAKVLAYMGFRDDQGR